MHLRSGILFSIFLLTLWSCKTAIQTVAPDENYEEVQFSPQESLFNIPLDFSIQEMQTLVNKYTEGVLYEDNNLEDDNFMVRVKKHSPITLSLSGNEIQYRVPLDLWLKGGAQVSTFGISLSDFEEVEGSIALIFKTKVEFDPFWNLKTTTRLVSYEWVQQPKFSIPLLNVPFKLVADKMIKSQQQSLAAIIDQQAQKSVNTRSYIESAWEYMHEPISISSDPPTWLKLKPKDLYVSEFSSNAQRLHITVGLKAITETVVGKKPKVVKGNLPNYRVEKNTSGMYAIQLAVNVSYEDITEMSRKYLQGQVYEFSNGKKKIIINDIHFYGNTEKMVIEVLLSGSINGKVYLKGIPVYDVASRKVVFSKLDFDVDTKNKLAKSANWLAHDVLVKKMTPYFSYYIGEYLDNASAQVKENLNKKQIHPNIIAEGSLDKIEPTDFVLTKEGLIALVDVTGTIKLFVTGLDKY